MNMLKILECSVVGFKRLALSHTKSFTITPNNIHLILGTNGSGKSSLMELLLVLPPNSSDFEEDGYRYLRFQFNDDIYEMYSYVNKHTLYKNNAIEIENCGINKMIEICRDYFNITPSIHKFILGRTTMSNMSLQSRKEFITSISGIDFDYVNKLYNNTKKSLKYNTDVIKHLSGKILSMKEYILSDVEVNNLREEKSRISELLRTLYEMKDNTIKYKEPVNIDVFRVDRRLSNVMRFINSRDDYEILLEATNRLSILHKEKNSRLNELSSKIMELNNSNTSIHKEKLLEVNSKIKELELNRTVGVEHLNKLIDLDEYKYNEAVSISLSLGSTTLEESNKELDIITTKISKKNKDIAECNDKILVLTTKVDAYKGAMKGLKCVECGFEFHEKSVSTLVESMLLEISDLELTLSKLNKELKDEELRKDEAISKIAQHNKLDYILDGYSIKTLPDYDASWKPFDIHKYLNNISRDIFTLKELSNLYDVRKELTIKISNSGDSTNMILELTKEYDSLSEIVNRDALELSEHQKKLDEVNVLFKDIELLNSFLAIENNNRRTSIVGARNNYINEIITKLMTKSDEIDKTLEKFNYMSKNVRESEDEIVELEKEKVLLEKLLKELSPSTGLIAETLKVFMLKYIEDVNRFIARVWSYRLEVLPYDVNEIERGMTYRFPVSVENEKPSKDINDTSESMREIINIAFRIVSLGYMGLSKYPLLIDEFGRSMDEVHLIKSYDVLEQICEETNVQMFIIAHIKSCYNRFRGFGVSIVSDLNLEELL